MAQRTRPEAAPEAGRDVARDRRAGDSEIRQRTIASMVTASLLAVLGTVIFAWALRNPDYPWLFAVGALPWLVGIVTFGRAVWTYLRS